MANKAPTETPTREWEDVRTGIGEEWDFDKNGNEPLIGHFIGSVVQQLTDKASGEDRATLVHQFAPESDPESIVFLWGAANLDKAMEQIDAGALVRVAFLGRENYTDKESGEPRQAKKYRVQVAKS